MPLHDEATERIRAQLHRIAVKERVPLIDIGYFTYQQHQRINAERTLHDLPLIKLANLVYVGRHHYDGRIEQGYTIDDMVLQIQAATAADCDIFVARNMTVLRAPLPRPDGYGNQVLDEGIFKLTKNQDQLELFSVIPKGDKISPLQKQQNP